MTRTETVKHTFDKIKNRKYHTHTHTHRLNIKYNYGETETEQKLSRDWKWFLIRNHTILWSILVRTTGLDDFNVCVCE